MNESVNQSIVSLYLFKSGSMTLDWNSVLLREKEIKYIYSSVLFPFRVTSWELSLAILNGVIFGNWGFVVLNECKVWEFNQLNNQSTSISHPLVKPVCPPSCQLLSSFWLGKAKATLDDILHQFRSLLRILLGSLCLFLSSSSGRTRQFTHVICLNSLECLGEELLDRIDENWGHF